MSSLLLDHLQPFHGVELGLLRGGALEGGGLAAAVGRGFAGAARTAPRGAAAAVAPARAGGAGGGAAGAGQPRLTHVVTAHRAAQRRLPQGQRRGGLQLNGVCAVVGRSYFRPQSRFGSRQP